MRETLTVPKWVAAMLTVAVAGCGSSTPSTPPEAGSSGSGGSAGTLNGNPGGSAGVSSAGAGGGAGSTSGGSSAGNGTSGSGGASAGSGGASGAGGGMPVGTQLSIDSQGHYTVVFKQPAWTFGGNLGVPPSNVANASGSDRLGSYSEVTFSYSDTSAKTGAIRAYDQTPVALFTVTYTVAGANTAPFPKLGEFPQLPHHLTYGTTTQYPFAPFNFTNLIGDSPWVYFDESANAFILSAADHFMNANTALSNGAIATGVDPAVKTIPAGTSVQTVLVAQPGINAAYQTWGHALTSWSGKKLPASDATPTLERFGYWTDHVATYYYNYDKTKGYTGTLLAVRDYFKQQGIPLAYMQLDSWWYPKGAGNIWSDAAGGQYKYAADKTLFPADLAAFETSIAMPFITHARWIDAASPYRQQYQMSNNISIDPAYWSSIATYLAASGVAVYEQDWLNQNALPLTNNLTDQAAFMDNMASAMAAKGLTMQYCMPLARHFLQSTKYDNLITTRVSDDGFKRSLWQDFLYSSRLASALGEWPWVDTFMSSQEDNLILATLSAGMVGVGDAIGAVNKANVFRSIRSDGIIVKPDAPIVPIDATFVNGAKGIDTPDVAATYSDFSGAGGLRASYVWAFNAGTNKVATFTPAALGQSGQVFVFNWFAGTGKVVDAAAPYTETLSAGTSGSRNYYIVVPLGPSGIALVGDAGKYASLGKKRVTQLTDEGTLGVSLAFASGEGPVTLRGYAATQPVAAASVGSAGPVTWSAATQMFTVDVTQDNGAAALTLH